MSLGEKWVWPEDCLDLTSIGSVVLKIQFHLHLRSELLLEVVQKVLLLDDIGWPEPELETTFTRPFFSAAAESSLPLHAPIEKVCQICDQIRTL